jgi:hypothetical protein
MAYVTPAEFGGAQGYLKQLDIEDDDALAKITAVLLRAEAVVNGVLGFAYDDYPAASEKSVRPQYGAYLPLPAHETGSVTAVTTMGGHDLDGLWEETGKGYLYAVDANGYEGNWNAGRYLVTAKWGYGPAPHDVKEVTLEIAVNIWRSAESGRFTNVVGASDGGAVGYEGALTPFQLMVLKDAKRRAIPQAV